VIDNVAGQMPPPLRRGTTEEVIVNVGAAYLNASEPLHRQLESPRKFASIAIAIVPPVSLAFQVTAHGSSAVGVPNAPLHPPNVELVIVLPFLAPATVHALQSAPPSPKSMKIRPPPPHGLPIGSASALEDMNVSASIDNAASIAPLLTSLIIAPQNE
jgi:hypothetical protein